MKTLNIKSFIGFLLSALIIMGCSTSSNNGHGDHEEHEGHEEHEEHEEGVVALSEQQMDAIGLKLVQIETRNMTLGIQVTGKLALPPQAKADISPILGGIVKTIRVIEGDKVKKGQVLATLEHPDFIQLQQDYINNVTTLEYLENEYNRQTKLYNEKVSSGKEYQKIKAEYNNKKSTVKALEIKLKMLGLSSSKIAEGKIYSTISIVAPISGIVSLVETNIGIYVEPLTKLFEVVNSTELHADFRVYEKDINKIKVGQKIYFTTTSLLGKEFEAEIHAISPVFEENPKALHVHADISNNKRSLIPGMYIKGRIVAENIETTVLPEHAIVTEEGKSYVFVKSEGEDHDHGHEETAGKEEHDHENHTDEKDDHDHGHAEHEEVKWEFEMIEVITGLSSEGYVEVKLLNELPKNSLIAGNGAYFLLAEMGKGETEHEH